MIVFCYPVWSRTGVRNDRALGSGAVFRTLTCQQTAMFIHRRVQSECGCVGAMPAAGARKPCKLCFRLRGRGCSRLLSLRKVLPDAYGVLRTQG